MRKIPSHGQNQEGKHGNDAETDVLDDPKEVVKPHPLDGMTALDLLNYRRRQSAKIISWFNSHKDFKYSSMCDNLGMSKGNFSMLIRKKNARISLELISKIETYISKYGYKP